jgi:hypothetical protein
VRLFFIQPFDPSCWTGVGALGAAFATGVMVARLRTINAARIKYVIEILHLLVGRDVRLWTGIWMHSPDKIIHALWIGFMR